MMATTVYLGWSGEKRKVIEAQWCANTIWWEINNFLFYTLTSKNLKISDSETISPNYYIVELTWWETNSNCSSSNLCKEINLSYSTWENPIDITPYKTLNISNTCQQNNQPLRFYRSWFDTTYVIMNKWFSPKSISDKNVFYLKNNTNNNISLLWNIIVWLCINSECSNPKEIWKFVADARSQTISFRYCKFYDNDNPSKCKTREGCQVYDENDPTTCTKY